MSTALSIIMHFPGCYPRKTRRNTPKRSTSTTSWVRRFRSWPRNRVHPTTDTVEELPEDELEELSNSNLQEESLPTSVACGAAYEHGPQNILVVEVHQAYDEEEPLKNLKTYGTAYEHAPQEGLVVKQQREIWVEKQPLRAPKESGAVFEYGFIEDLPINPACDRTEETPCVSKVALPGCDSECFLQSISSSDEEENAECFLQSISSSDEEENAECFLQSISSSDEEENADSPHDCCP
ncbi:uncharacterized protein LOC112585126 isoform X2 [Bubalus bubalis]|uniref:uncharacterized protein LOC112585126 isoform X2 n=1 Tax=Bubalus bubalis TaxID=89462 RepID=UPI001E1B86B9|nr:uncharacterized protein LOC112585126 isoform X2 [Bubalus bubalis]XP_044799155.2 uncharacterized protein LOC112585126 isoform X2 [Bubalus bubalis]